MWIKLSELKKGDFFRWTHPFGETERFHSLDIIKDGRYHIYLMSNRYAGILENAYAYASTMRDDDILVFIPIYYMSEKKKTKGRPCLPVNCQRHILPENTNKINVSEFYCSHDKYWYNLANDTQGKEIQNG